MLVWCWCVVGSGGLCCVGGGGEGEVEGRRPNFMEGQRIGLWALGFGLPSMGVGLLSLVFRAWDPGCGRLAEEQQEQREQ